MDVDTGTGQRATWVVTTQTEPWVAQQAIDLVPLTISSMADFPSVMVRTSERRQTIDGFGGCFNELGWRALQRLTEEDRSEAMDSLFGDEAGAGLSICRMPIGANDFSTDWYSFDETDGDFALDDFRIDHDKDALVPYIREALRRRPDLRLWASPWSPPSWMKTNKHYAAALPFPGSGVVNGLEPHQVGTEGTDMFVLQPDYLDAYARYFGKFIEAYRAEGIEISMVMPQNEFNSPQVFPSCTWTPSGLAQFVKVLGPEMDRLGVAVGLGTSERPDPALITDVLDDAEAAQWITAAGFQWAGKGAIPEIHRHVPGLRLYQTEQECGDGRNDWRFARHAWSLMKHFLSNGTNVYTYWNLALEVGGVSRWGWAQNSLIVVDPQERTYSFTHEYHLLRHLSGFVRPGAVRLEAFSWSGYENQLVFANPDGSVVIVVQNDLSEDAPYAIAVDDQVLRTVLPADSFSTIVLPAPASS